ncbi:basic salivary proline-rich protein 2-like [Oryzias latipes]|uniref:basic salivary proline-rich protein 2-like n=1 Tax=Oryzias latipes TaxID=8090 RepID=UPI000CE224D3|nr:basic salivary proline-rich protein 2-like [Oryzias latipes]
MGQLMGKMALWGFASQLFLFALLGWNAHSSPIKDLSQQDHLEGNYKMWLSSDHQNDKPSDSDSGITSQPGSVSWVVTRPSRKAWSGFPSSPSGAVPWMGETPKGKSLGTRSNPEVSADSMPVELQKLPGPSVNPEGPAVSWLVEPSKLPGLSSNPEGPAVSWAVVNPPKLPPPPFKPSVSMHPWQVKTPTKKQNSLLNPESLPLSWVAPKYPGRSNSKGSSWVVKPPKSGTPSSTDYPSFSLDVNTPKVPEPATNPEGFGMSWLDSLARKTSFPMPSESTAPWGPSEITDPSPSGPEDIGTAPTDESLADPQLGHEVDFSFESKIPQMEGGLDHSDSEVETEGEDPVLPYAPMFQGGTLRNSEAVYEQGNSEKMTDYIDSPSPYASTNMQSSFSPYIKQRIPHLFYLFVTGQFPHGTVSHMQSEYEVGRDRTTQVGYEQYVIPGNSKSSQTLFPPVQQLLQEFQS